MNKRLNITLPEQTVRLMDRVAGKGQRSSLIDRAVRRYVKEETRANIRKQLTEAEHHDERDQAGRQVFPVDAVEQSQQGAADDEDDGEPGEQVEDKAAEIVEE